MSDQSSSLHILKDGDQLSNDSRNGFKAEDRLPDKNMQSVKRQLSKVKVNESQTKQAEFVEMEDMTKIAVTPSTHPDVSYGWMNYRPLWLQRFCNSKWILLCLCLNTTLQGMVVNGFINVVISNIERRFDMSSTESGMISSFYDIASVLCLIPVSYFGGLGKKPRYLFIGALIMGLGSFIFALPHFIVDVYKIPVVTENVCLNQTTMKHCHKEGALNSFKYFFYFGQLLHGAGATPLYTLGITYLDENLPKKVAPVYIAIFYSMSICGPAIGYIAGGRFLNLHTNFMSIDPNEELTDTSNPKWVGAWWIGFLISASLAVFCSFLISGFPNELPKKREHALERQSDVYSTDATDSATQVIGSSKAGFKHILNSAKILFTNPVLVFLSLAAACEGFLLSGFATFTPKFIQSQFFIASSKAALYVGFAVIPAGGGGTFFGGYFIKKFKFSVLSILRYCIILAACSFVLLLAFLVQCDTLAFAGINSQYGAYSHPRNNTIQNQKMSDKDLNSHCNKDCMCSPELFSPVCGEDGYSYYSPCYAGCHSAEKLNDEKIFNQCQCVTATNSSDQYGQAVDGLCELDCSYVYVFMSFFSIVMLLTFLMSQPALQATIRCVPFNLRSLALGIQWLIARLCGSIPGPIIFGKVIDLTCTLWYTACGDDRGSCRFYSNETMGKYIMALAMVAKFVSFLFFLTAMIFYRRNKGARTKKISDSENMTTT